MEANRFDCIPKSGSDHVSQDGLIRALDGPGFWGVFSFPLITPSSTGGVR